MFDHLHLVRDLPGTLSCIHALLAPDGLFMSKTAFVGDMNPVIRLALLPAMRAIGTTPERWRLSGRVPGRAYIP
ncbi:hypothetical protein [Brucella cytisi]|uniref:hypothetical protein n=1 Tax=Brucella cytisi TaxID=407152 RepID=UPI0016B96F52|nr:class I SAM-dependent methyltransferase [Brucella cytisi]